MKAYYLVLALVCSAVLSFAGTRVYMIERDYHAQQERAAQAAKDYDAERARMTADFYRSLPR